MKIGQIINDYTVLGVEGKPFSTKGSGLSMWTFVRKDGVDYFMKEFLSPTYPIEGSPGSGKTKAEKRLKCEKFESHHQMIKERCKHVAAGTNLIITVDFFRFNTKYYKITEKVDVSTVGISEISTLPIEKKILILKTATHSLDILHKLKIVHGDLKPNNILIKERRKEFFTSKLIDFDNSYISGEPPIVRDDIVGDPAYYSPELEDYILNREHVNGSDVSVQSDIFALGLIFCQYLTGQFPLPIVTGKYASNIVNNGGILEIKNDGTLPEELLILVNSMLLKSPLARPAVHKVFEVLKK